MLRISPGSERNGDCFGLVMFGVFWSRGADVNNVAISFIEYFSIPSVDHLRWISEPVIRRFGGEELAYCSSEEKEGTKGVESDRGTSS